MILKTNFNSGVLIKSNKRNSLNVLSRNDIINLFLKNVCIIFKGFNLNPKSLLDFTNKFTYIYANDANRRTEVYDKKIKTVDEGNQEMPLHSEASYSPSWPEIIWFYCVKPPKKSGWTTICDGKKIYQDLSTKTKKFFLANPITYKMDIPYGNNTIKKKPKKIRDWFVNAVGVKKSKIDMNNKSIYIELDRYSVSKLKNSQDYAFSNHLQIILERDPQLLSWRIGDRNKLPSKIQNELKKICTKNTYKIKWEKGDLCMIDNKRFMHGRTKINKNDQSRQILNIQTLTSNLN
jgi:alpha-ketoglutarate-dependent taurine dioxygenase